MAEPRYKKTLEYAKAHPESSHCRNFVTLAGMYARHADWPTYGLIMGCGEDVEKEMAAETKRPVKKPVEPDYIV